MNYRGRGPHPYKEDAIALLRAGRDAKEVALAIGAHEGTVRQWAYEAHIPMPRRPRRLSPSKDERKGDKRQRGEELLREGKTPSEVARLVGVSYERARQYRKKAGIQPSITTHPKQDAVDALLCQKFSDSEIVRQAGASRPLIARRRRALGLPPSSPRKLDLAGRQFGRLRVIDVDLERSGPVTIWRCECECGRLVSVRRSNLLNGLSKSCGCRLREPRKRH